jgi:hypothetical protein
VLNCPALGRFEDKWEDTQDLVVNMTSVVKHGIALSTSHVFGTYLTHKAVIDEAALSWTSGGCHRDHKSASHMGLATAIETLWLSMKEHEVQVYPLANGCEQAVAAVSDLVDRMCGLKVLTPDALLHYSVSVKSCLGKLSSHFSSIKDCCCTRRHNLSSRLQLKVDVSWGFSGRLG